MEITIIYARRGCCEWTRVTGVKERLNRDKILSAPDIYCYVFLFFFLDQIRV